MLLEELKQRMDVLSPVRVEPLPPTIIEAGGVKYVGGEFVIYGNENIAHELGHVKLFELGYPDINARPIDMYDFRGLVARHAIMSGYIALTHPLIWQYQTGLGLSAEVKEDLEFGLNEAELDIVLNASTADRIPLPRHLLEADRNCWVVKLLPYRLGVQKYASEISARAEEVWTYMEREHGQTEQIRGKVADTIEKYFEGRPEDMLERLEADFKYLLNVIGTDITVTTTEKRTKAGGVVRIWNLKF